jgi:hypothetical protein
MNMRLQIVWDNGQLVTLPAGGQLEIDLIETCVKHILAKGVGVFRTETHVEQDIRDGIREAIMALKDQTRFVHS